MLIEVQLIKILAGNISISLSLTYHYSAACSVCSASAAGGSAAGAGSVRKRGQQMYSFSKIYKTACSSGKYMYEYIELFLIYLPYRLVLFFKFFVNQYYFS